MRWPYLKEGETFIQFGGEMEQEQMNQIRQQLDRMEEMMARYFGVHRGDRTVPKDWQPDVIRERMIRLKPGVDRDFELQMFRAHEFASPKTDWNRAWFQWLSRATPRRSEDVRKQTVSREESRHPALVAERANRTMKFGEG